MHGLINLLLFDNGFLKLANNLNLPLKSYISHGLSQTIVGSKSFSISPCQFLYPYEDESHSFTLPFIALQLPPSINAPKR